MQAKTKRKATGKRGPVQARAASSVPTTGALRDRLDAATTWYDERPEAREFKRPEWACFEAFQSDDGETAELHLYDVIGTYELNAATFRDALNYITAKNITVKINSPGGSVFDGFAMYSDLKAHPANIRVEVTGLAASAASLVAMAGDEIVMADNGFMMIHNASVFVAGDRREMARANRVLAQIDKRLAKTYATRSGRKEAAFADMMDEETWFDSEDAVKAGLADSIGESVDAKNLAHDFNGFIKAPDAIKRAARRNATSKQAPAKADETSTDGMADLVAAMRACSLSIGALTHDHQHSAG
jgi:ATP-dependent Clp protease, protease subunit